jgi:hypothetical protein
MTLTAEDKREILELIDSRFSPYNRRERYSKIPPANATVPRWNKADGRWEFVTLTGSTTTIEIQDDDASQGNASIVDFGTGLTATVAGVEGEISVNDAEITHDNLSGGTSADAHHPQTHTIVSHDTTGTGGELTRLTDGSNVDDLHAHASTGGGVTDHGALTGLTDNDHPQYVRLPILLASLDHNILQNLASDDHPQYARQAVTEVISGEWTWEEAIQFNVGTAPAAPAEDHFRVKLVESGGNLIWRGYGPTGDTCDICTVSNVVVAHTNTLALNWVE